MKTVKLFKNGRSQAIRLPKEFRFEGAKVVSIRKEGKAVILEPVEEFSWSAWWDSWNPVGEAFMPGGRGQPPPQKREELD